jgi:putative ABC transport system permease protein
MRAALLTLALGVKSLMLHKLRTALTMLGIMFGVFAVIAMLAIGEGASYEAQEQIKALGSTNIMISSRKPPEVQAGGRNPMSAIFYGLDYDDADRIAQTLAAVDLVVPIRESAKEFRADERSMPGVLLGTTPEFLDVMRMRIAEGRWLTPTDGVKRDNVAVLGAAAANKLFPLVNPIGRTILASGDRFVVAGVLGHLGRATSGIGPSLDECIYIPIETSRSWLGEINIKRSSGTFESEGVELHDLVVRVRTPDLVLDTARVLRRMVAANHPKGDFEMTVPLELLQQAQESTRIFNILLGTIAGISLLVGGIGIMNVMLATVTERTREIGIRRALGARRRNIVTQFLVETVVIGLAGGVLGLALGILTPILVTHFFEMKTLMRLEHSLLAFFVSALVGVIAGLYPAWRAASMDPVEALRHE